MSGKVNLEKVLLSYDDKGLGEIEEIIGEWAFEITDLPVRLKMEVVYVMPQGKFMGIANYQIQNPKQGTPYMSIYQRDNVEEALFDALNGFLDWIPEKYKDKTKFVPVEDW
ncbi:MAG: hypothetical protein ABSB89_02755 [Candidatus Bathyarchaeia archaeon]|jgi:hypothetical protein